MELREVEQPFSLEANMTRSELTDLLAQRFPQLLKADANADYAEIIEINIDEIKRLRSYDVTRVEIGYQTTIDEINEMNKR